MKGLGSENNNDISPVPAVKIIMIQLSQFLLAHVNGGERLVEGYDFPEVCRGQDPYLQQGGLLLR